MFRLIRKHLKGAALASAVLAPLCMLAEVFMDLQQPTLMSKIIDVGVANGDLNYVLRTGGLMILFAVLGLLGGAGCSVFATYASVNMAGDLREGLFEKVFSLSDAEMDKLETSALITRLTNDVQQVQEMLAQMLRAMSRSPMTFIGGIIMAFTLSPKLAIILCAVIPVILTFAIIIIRRAIPMYTTVQERLDGINTVMRENLLGIRVVKAFTLEERQVEKFERANKPFAKDSAKAQKTTFLLMPIVMLIMNLSVVAVLWFGGLMEIEGALPMGRIMAFVNYMVQITNALVNLVNASVNISRSRASAIRILEIMDTETSVLEPENPKLPANGDVSFKNVTFRYTSGEPVLKDISLNIPQGRRVGVIGTTGCGKSTLAALMVRLYDPVEGSIKLGGVDIRDIPAKVLHDKIGLVLQESLLFSGTVAENLRYGDSDADDGALWRAAETAEAGGFLKELPDEMGSGVAQRGKNFSGGQKQRLSIARSLLHAPDVLILDDSTSAVDVITEARLHRAIRSEMDSSTLIIIAQRVSSIMDCDEILVMDKGRVVGEGSHQQLLVDCDIYREIALSQLGEDVLYA